MEAIKKIKELSFAHLAPEVWEKLGKIPRTGWVKRGVSSPETVQEHTVSLRILANELVSDIENISETDKNDLLDMLEVHDWAEVDTGDEVIVTNDLVEKKRLKEDKFRRENEAMLKIKENLGLGGEREFLIYGLDSNHRLIWFQILQGN